MAYMEARFRVPLGLRNPPGVHLLWYAASSKPEAPGLVLSPLFGQNCYCPETTLVEVPAWPVPLGGSQATSAFSLGLLPPGQRALSCCLPQEASRVILRPPTPLPLPAPCPFPRGLPARLVTLGQLEEGHQSGETGKQGFWGQLRAAPSGRVSGMQPHRALSGRIWATRGQGLASDSFWSKGSC